MQPIENKIISRFYGRGRGHIATQKNFLDLGPRPGIDKALSRLVQNGKLRRIARGLYEYPRENDMLGKLSPDPEKVAKALAGKETLRLQPTGAYAANRLHLSEQVPMRVVFLTDGESRKIKIGSQTIELRKVGLKRMQLAGRVSGLVCEALRHLGKEHIGEKEINTIRQQLSSDEKQQLRKDIPKVPEWMHRILRQATGAEGERA